MLEQLVAIPYVALQLFANQPNLPSKQGASQQQNQATYTQASRNEPQGIYCGTQEEIYSNSPRINPKDFVITIEYTSKIDNKQIFSIIFYTNHKKYPNPPGIRSIIDTEDWVDKKDFYTFVIFEHDKKDLKKHSTASGYFGRGFMFILYDLINRKFKDLPISEPDGYVDDVACHEIGGKRISSLISDVLEKIASERIKFKTPKTK